MEYLVNPKASLAVYNQNGEATEVGNKKAVEAIIEYNKTIELIQKDIPVDIFSLLGMRNLSSSWAKYTRNVFLGVWTYLPQILIKTAILICSS